MRWLLLAAAAAACAWIYTRTEEKFPVERGRPRVVSLVPSLTENLYAAGGGDALVGVTRFCDYPSEARKKPKVGDVLEDFEAILALRPSVIVSSDTMRADLNARLERIGLRVERFDAATLSDIAAHLERLAKVADVPAIAANAFRARLDRLAVKNPARRPTVYFEINPDPPMTVGCGNYMHDLILQAGGRNAFEDLEKPAVVIDWEYVVARQPDVLIFSKGLEKQVQTRPGWSVVRGRACFVNMEIYVRPTPRILDALREFSKLLQP